MLVYLLVRRKLTSYDMLCPPHHSLEGTTLLYSAASIPDDTAAQPDAFSGAAVERPENAGTHTVYR